jgi:O-antigen ligase
LLAIVVYPILHYGKKLLRPMALTGYVASIIAVVCLFFVAVHFNNRYEQVEHVIENYAPSTTIIADTTTAEENSTSARLHIWRYAAEAIQDNPVIGAGTGDVRDELESVFNKYNYSFGLKHHLNAHNQFLHTGIALGLVGMLLLLSLFIAGFIGAFRERNFVYLLFLLIIFLNCLTESLLERQVGILCFCFFNSLYAVLLIRRSKDIKIPSL